MKEEIRVTKSSPPIFKLVPKEHFWVSGLKKSFDLSGLIPLYAFVMKEYQNIKPEEDREFTIGRNTIVYSLDCNQNINLITGWVGNRHKHNV